MEEADSDVLLLYDCCHSAAITTTGFYQGNKGAKEVIAACGYETIAPEVDKHSFTNALIETLALASKGTPFSVGELHSRVLSRLKCWTASLLYDQDGKVLQTQDGNLTYERQPRRTPIYSVLRESKPRRSIVLAPLIPPQTTPENGSQEMPSITPQVVTPQPDRDGSIVSSTNPKKRKAPAEEEPKWPQIVLSVRLDEAELDIVTWREWIRSLPTEARDIKIEGMYKSFSTLLLIRMPVSVWNLLPDDRAYSFVGYVTSENLAMPHDQGSQAMLDEVIDETHSAKVDDTPLEGVPLFYGDTKVGPKRIATDIAPSEFETPDISWHSTKSRPLGPLDQITSSFISGISYGPPKSQFATTAARAYACLTMGMRIANVTESFASALSIDTPTLFEQTLYHVVRPQEHDRVLRLQRSFEAELRQRVPDSLPSIYLEKSKDNRIIEFVETGLGLLAQLHFNYQEILTFQTGNDENGKSFHVRAALAKEESTCFIVIWLQIPQSIPQVSSKPIPVSHLGLGSTKYR